MLERNSTFQKTLPQSHTKLATTEALVVRVLGSSGKETELILTPQLYPTAALWCDEGSPPIIRPGGEAAAELTHSADLLCQWLRLGELTGEPSITLIIYLTLKE